LATSLPRWKLGRDIPLHVSPMRWTGRWDVTDGTDPAEALKRIGAHAKAYAQLTGTVAAA